MSPRTFLVRLCPALLFCCFFWFTAAIAAEKPSLIQVGAAKVDITPDYPIRLSGYGGRTNESQGIDQRLFAKALAIGSDKDGPAILLTVDNLAVPANLRDEIAAWLKKKAGIRNERLAVCSSHTHTAPMLTGVIANLFGADIAPEEKEHIDRYTRELTEKLEQVALAALKARQPTTLSWGRTKASFAANRRTKGGPVDDDLPVLVCRDKSGTISALLVNYACHCTTLSDTPNHMCGDWAGFAQERLEAEHPGAVALVAIGCGGDANPSPRTGLDFARQHGQSVATAVNELLAQTLAPLRQKLECRAKSISLPFDTARTREEWEQRAQSPNHWIAYHARKNLARLARGEMLQTHLPYFVQTWNFGSELAMVFLPGEVVVDYSLRLKREFDASRMWVNAYANDVPCYIPSKRIWTEGGYEGGDAMIYYDRPTRLAEQTEELIVAAVHQLIPTAFLASTSSLEYPAALSPKESLAAMRTKAGFEIQLVAAEPLIVDPVAIDWGPDGKLWVVEMRDYPSGMGGNWKPGSRIKYLEDTNGDGIYDKATVFLDNLPFATGVTAWRKGVLVCTAPDILFAEDTDGDGRADIVKKIFTGFYTDNYQARVNSLNLGLDNWIYGANGLLGGVIRGVSNPVGNPSGAIAADSRSTNRASVQVDIRGRDFRMNPDTGAFEPASGLTQQGRARDDWGNWFGCDNSTIAWHYPIADHYLRRNPHVTAPSPRVSIAAGDDPNLLHPISRTLERFNDPQSANRVTSGCGLGIYRDELLGQDFYGNAFLCEPVHNLVHRLVLEPKDATFAGKRAENEQQSEFLASRDNWFRPVQARTGPDGALYVVDMYRFVIEHPRWIPAERLAKLDVRAGDDKGRIYRIVPKGKKLRPIADLTKVASAKLAASLDTPNGTERDRIHQELICRVETNSQTIAALESVAASSKSPAARLQALCVLDGLKALKPALLLPALADGQAGLRANAIRLSEGFLDSQPSVVDALLKLRDDGTPAVRFQLTLSLGQWNDERAGQMLGRLAQHDMGDPWMRAAILSSATRWPAELLKEVLSSKSPGRSEMINQLIATAAGEGRSLGQVIAAIAPLGQRQFEPWQLTALSSLLDAVDRKNLTLAELASGGANGTGLSQETIKQLNQMFDWAGTIVADSKTADALRDPAIRLLGRRSPHVPQTEDLKLLVALLDGPLSTRLQNAVLDTLKRNRSQEVATLMLAGWKLRSPSLRQSCIEVLLTRPEWAGELVSALESGVVAPSEISPANRQRLSKSASADLQQRARNLWPSQAGSSRAEILAKFQGATTLPGDSSRGAVIFGKTCATCHFLRGQGHEVGPNLAALSNKSPSDFLVAILDPNAAVEPRFVAYNISLKDGRALSGIVSAETATTLTLNQSGALQEKILRSDIEEIRASGVSLMPEGLEQNLSPQDMADLIAFLKSSPREFGSATPEQAAQAKTAFLAGGMNGLAKLTSAFDQLAYPSWMGMLPMPYCRQTDGQAKVVWETAPVPAGLPANGVYQFRLPAAMGFVSQPSGSFELRLNKKPLLEFNVTLTDQSWQSANGQARMTYNVMESNTEDSNGVLVIEVPVAMLESGKPATFEVIGSAAGGQRWFGIYLLR
jgi:putative membrane-bound dehydrogenase-like protein